MSVGGAGIAASTDLQRDSWVADVVVGPRPPTNQEEHSTAYREERSNQAERLGVEPAISHEPDVRPLDPLRLLNSQFVLVPVRLATRRGLEDAK